MLGEAIIVVGRQQACTLFKRPVIGLLVLFIQISPIAFNVAAKALLDELGKFGVLAGQVIHSPAGNNLAGGEDGIDYE